MKVWRPSWQSVVVSMVMCAAILWGAWFVGVVHAATPATPWPTVGRIAQQQGESGTVAWTVADASQYELILGGDTVLPEGMLVTQTDTTLTLHLAASQVGTSTAQLDLRCYVKPAIEGWAGPMLELTHRCAIEWHVLPPVTDPFLPGLGDILATPNP